MKALFKKYWPIVLLLFVCGGVLSIGYNFLSDLLYSKALAAAKAEYDQKIADANARIKVNTEHYSAIIGKAERELGWKPRITYREGFRQTMQWLKTLDIASLKQK